MTTPPPLAAARDEAERLFSLSQAHYRADHTSAGWERQRRALQSALESAWAELWRLRSDANATSTDHQP